MTNAAESRVFFVHDGRRMATLEEEFSAVHPGQFKSLNFWDYQEMPEIEEHLAPLLADIDDKDVLLLDVSRDAFETPSVIWVR